MTGQVTHTEQLRSIYGSWEGQCRQRGLSARHVTRARNELSDAGPPCRVRREAYVPTGAALGCPLPDPTLQASLVELAESVTHSLATGSDGSERVFAFVPSDHLHVTVVNRSHFRSEEYATTGNRSLSPEEFGQVDHLCRERRFPTIRVRFERLALTPHGALVVTGWPGDERLHDLRSALLDAFPFLRGHVTWSAHIKLGHVLVRPSRDQIGDLLDTLAAMRLDHEIHFPDLHTPCGRIPLHADGDG